LKIRTSGDTCLKFGDYGIWYNSPALTHDKPQNAQPALLGKMTERPSIECHYTH
jgi:hypothetical protein